MDIQGRHSKNHDKLDECLSALQKIDSDIVVKSQLWTFYNNARRCWTALDQEFIECRKHRKLTLKYTEFEENFTECVKEFQRWSLMSILMKK